MLLIMSTKAMLSAAAASALMIAGGIWLIRRRTKRRIPPDVAAGRPSQEPPAPYDDLPPGEAPSPEHLADIEPEPTENLLARREDLLVLATRAVDPDLREFLVEIANRVEEEGADLSDQTPFSFIEEVVDRLDDLRTMLPNHHGNAAKDIATFRETLIVVLSSCGAELIHSELWDASIQRAIAKETTPGLNAPTILRFGSTGIRRHGQIVRKQEVFLTVPESN